MPASPRTAHLPPAPNAPNAQWPPGEFESPGGPPGSPSSGTPGGAGPPGERPLVIARNTGLAVLRRLASAAGVEVEVAPDPITAGASWSRAPLVLVDAELGPECVRARLPRRRELVLVDVRAEVDGVGSGGYDAVSPAGGAVGAGHEVGTASVGTAGLGAAGPGAAGLGVAGAGAAATWEVATELAAEQVVFLPDGQPWLVDRIARCDIGQRGAGRVIGVIGGRGGAGATVLAAALSLTATRLGLRTLLVDLDPFGGGIDVVLGAERSGGLRWPDLIGAGGGGRSGSSSEGAGRLSVPPLVERLVRIGSMGVLSWDRGEAFDIEPDVVRAVVAAGRSSGDLVVLDLSRRLDDGVIRALQLADQVLLVVPAEVRACVSAGRVGRAIAPHCTDVRVVVRGPAPGSLRAGEVAKSLSLPLAGSAKAQPGLAVALERGEVPVGRRGPLAELCRRLLRAAGLPGGQVAAA